jgi:hypothetical protein
MARTIGYSNSVHADDFPLERVKSNSESPVALRFGGVSISYRFVADTLGGENSANRTKAGDIPRQSIHSRALENPAREFVPA